MSERIEKGDCVMIVRGHSCVLNRYSGIPYIVGAIRPALYGMKCNLCGEMGIEAPCDYADLQAIEVPMRWLKKIKPLGEGERSIMRAELCDEYPPLRYRRSDEIANIILRKSQGTAQETAGLRDGEMNKERMNKE